MRIDVNVPAAAVAPKATPQQLGSSLLFEDLFSQSPEQEAATKATPSAPSQQLFSFDALGILGLGGGPRADPPHLQETVTQLSAALVSSSIPVAAPIPVSVVPASTEMQGSHGMPLGGAHGVSAGRQGLAQQLANGEILHPSLASLDGGLVAAVPPTGTAAEVAPPPAEPPSTMNTGLSFLARPGALYNTMLVVNVSASTVAQLRPVMPGANVISDDAAMPSADTPEVEEQTASNDVLSPPELVPQVEPSSDSISVTVSETDGTMQVMAAAPDVTDLARLKIRAIAQNIAGEIGVKLGEFSLNGKAISHSFNLVDRRPSWQFHL